MEGINKFLKWSSVVLVFVVTVCNVWIVRSTSDQIFSDTQQILGSEVGLVLGTSNQLSTGDANPFFDNRIRAAYELLESGKVVKLVLSGSKDSIYYNEPKMMSSALQKLGVRESDLILDNGGNRTLTSLKRLRDHLGYSSCVIVTQSNHAYRSLFIANHLGLDAVCYSAESPKAERHYIVLVREIFARTKAIIDLYVLRL